MGVRTPNLGQRQQARRQQQHIRRMERPTGFKPGKPWKFSTKTEAAQSSSTLCSFCCICSPTNCKPPFLKKVRWCQGCGPDTVVASVVRPVLIRDTEPLACASGLHGSGEFIQARCSSKPAVHPSPLFIQARSASKGMPAAPLIAPEPSSSQTVFPGQPAASSIVAAWMSTIASRSWQ